jgi:hypothetical protein
MGETKMSKTARDLPCPLSEKLQKFRAVDIAVSLSQWTTKYKTLIMFYVSLPLAEVGRV